MAGSISRGWRAELREGRIVGVRGETGANRIRAFFAHDFRTMLGVDRRHFRAQNVHLLAREQARKNR
jgi:hypothetical protein